jgi:ankyrin repeat protein
MMSRTLPARPNLEHLKKQAKALLRAYGRGAPEAVAAFGSRSPGARRPKLADAQRALARQYGFPKWIVLTHHVASLAGDDPAAALEAAVRLNDAERVRDVLARFPAMRARLDDAMPTGDFGATPLITAARQRNLAMIDVLLDAGADPDQRSHWWAGSFSAFGDDPAVNAHLIARGAAIDAHDAARLGMVDRLRALVAADPSVVNARFGDGQTPLHVASTVEIATYLLDRGADIDALDVDHESTPAQYLIREHQDVVRNLVDRGCRTDILLACALGDAALVRRHLDRDPESVRTTVSPRWFPMRNERAGGIIYIWTLGSGVSAHGVAQAFGHDDLSRLLVDRSPDDLRLAIACEADDEGELRRLLGAKPDASALLTDETRARLVTAAAQNRTRTVQLMLAYAWPADVRDAKGTTPLHWAGWHGNAEMARELLARGADRDAVESTFGGTPLGWATHGAEVRDGGDYDRVIEVLKGDAG